MTRLMPYRIGRAATAIASMAVFGAVFFELTAGGVLAVALLCLLTLSATMWVERRTRRSTTALLSPASWIILALAAVSCGGNATGPTPGTAAGSWAGPMKITTQITGDGINLVIVADGTLRWSRDDGDLAALRGGALYTPASGGRLTVTYTQQVSGCSEGGTGPLPYGSQNGTLVLEPNGAYTLAMGFRESPPFPTQVTCGPVTVTRPGEVVFLEGFSQAGTRVDGRIKGGWIKREGNATYTATWDLTPS